jgi:hypothetical protein
METRCIDGDVNVPAMDERLAFATELEERDLALAGRIDALAEISAEVDSIRARAAEIESALSAAPAERSHLDEADAEVERDRELAQAGLAEAEAALEGARGEDAREAARQRVARAGVDAHAVDERRDRLVARRARLEQEVEQLGTEKLDLDRRAGEAATRLEESSRVSSIALPEPGLAGLVDWGARAHAAVVVARGGLESERERVVREANELASSVLGEPLYTASVAHVRSRLEEKLA